MSSAPAPVKAGSYHFAVGTAGSTGLVLQTILFPLLHADGPSHLILEGGTHAAKAPPFEFIEQSFLPLVNRMGPTVTARLHRHGFYPRGGGRLEIEITPAPLHPITLVERGALRQVSATALYAALPKDIPDKELAALQTCLDWPDDRLVATRVSDDQGPGNALLLRAEFEHTTELVSGFGELGVSAHRVGTLTAKRMAGFLGSHAFAGPYLQDQLLLPMALARRGRFTTVSLTQHSKTAMEIIHRFTGQRFETTLNAHRSYDIEVI